MNRLHDRCDRCGAQAFVQVTSRTSGYDLLLCGHHFNRHESRLVEGGWIVDDQRERINSLPGR